MMNDHLIKHGDGVRDVAFSVEDSRAIYETSMSNGAESVLAPVKIEDENGYVWICSIKTYGETTHTFVERTNYNGIFLPGFKKHAFK